MAKNHNIACTFCSSKAKTTFMRRERWNTETHSTEFDRLYICDPCMPLYETAIRVYPDKKLPGKPSVMEE